VAVVAALCLSCNAADDATLTVGQCIGDNATIGPVEEALIKEDIIEENLLETKVTNVVCKDMLKPISASTPLQKLAAAQSYIQEIKLIEGAMREAASEEATRAPAGHSSSNESLMQFGALAYTSELAAAQAQYDDAIGGIEPRELQAAAAARVGENPDASIANRLRKKEVVANNAGASVSEARASARCSLEVNVLDEELDKELDKSKGLYEIDPHMPKKMRHEDTKQAGLLVLPATKERFRAISQKHELVAETSESDIGCVRLTDRMEATLVQADMEELGVHRDQPDDVRKLSSELTTKWGWYITAHQTGKLRLQLDLRYAISKEGQEFRAISKSPIYYGAVKAKPLQSESTHKGKEESWWQNIISALT